MQTTTLQSDLNDRYLLKVLLLLLSISCASHIMAGEDVSQKSLEEDLLHWLSLYRPAETVEISEEIACLAQNIYFEARSESEQGQLAVGHVVMNRVAHKRYPDSVCAVVKQGGERRRHRCQFSWWCDGRSDQPMNQKAWQQSLQLARTILAGDTKDPTDGALWYHADYVNPEWSSILVLGKKIGQHLFYLSKKQPVFALNTSSGS
ncbi:cell wall hydrolase [Candidatus Thiodiazotropha sp. CDECU1]|uniref:cell wall hydrolase n=1 Tax=Candidatus Thiodiazotropha sp. CDECU1 TaxID=3065865 RepID=UPI00292E2D1F|nr:cell wall hydrolase [Candidatus Thiodiazotropha sp. CDECU1]